MRRLLVRAFAGWRTGLSGPVIVLQAGTAVNYFGYGLIVPFEIIYLHQARRCLSMSLYTLTFATALALGPAVGGAVLATSPDAV